jgi:hypothetical protein
MWFVCALLVLCVGKRSRVLWIKNVTSPKARHYTNNTQSNNNYVCHQFFFNYHVPTPITTRVLFSMRVRRPTRVRFISISISITDDDDDDDVAFLP